MLPRYRISLYLEFVALLVAGAFFCPIALDVGGSVDFPSSSSSVSSVLCGN